MSYTKSAGKSFRIRFCAGFAVTPLESVLTEPGRGWGSATLPKTRNFAQKYPSPKTKGPGTFPPPGLNSVPAISPIAYSFKKALQLQVKEETQRKGEQCQRLHEHQAENHRRANASRSSRVARDALASGRRDASLPQSPAEGRHRDAKAYGNRQRGRIDRRLF